MKTNMAILIVLGLLLFSGCQSRQSTDSKAPTSETPATVQEETQSSGEADTTQTNSTEDGDDAQASEEDNNNTEEEKEE